MKSVAPVRRQPKPVSALRTSCSSAFLAAPVLAAERRTSEVAKVAMLNSRKIASQKKKFKLTLTTAAARSSRKASTLR